MGKKTKENYEELYNELIEKYRDETIRLETEKLDAYDEIDLLKAANESAKKEITSLRHTIGGYITHTAKMKKDLSNLRTDYEVSKKSINELTQELIKKTASIKDKIIEAQQLQEEHKKEVLKLSGEITKLTNEFKNQEKAYFEMERLKDFYKNNYEYFKSLPWYKRILVK